MTPEAFVAKWRQYAGKESSAYMSHFDDLCRMLGHATPAEADPAASFFCFQKAAEKDDGRPGFADVYYRRRFGWEYKGNHKDLEGTNGAYAQLLRYRENLANPPLLIVSDFTQMIVRTNFTNAITKRYHIRLEDLVSGKRLEGTPWTALEILRACFEDPDMLNPGKTPAMLTEGASMQFARLADSLRKDTTHEYDPAAGRAYVQKRRYSDEQVAKFLTRMVFVLFASDVGLLPANLVTALIDRYGATSPKLAERFAELFRNMATGGDFGPDPVPHFNGGLFADDEALEISSDVTRELKLADQLDWSDIEPSIFGTLFERILDPARRKQIGAHYTSRADIELLVRPVLMEPLEREWAEIEPRFAGLNLLKTGAGIVQRREEARALAQGFLDRLGAVRVLDPACGSGNFLYVSLALLKELEQKVRAAAAAWGITELKTRVHPRQLHGIEIDPYAHELASIVVWIGYLQWKRKNGVPFETETPILEPFTNFQQMDALLDLTDPEHPREPEWPEAEVIVGNPPFLGGKLLRRNLGDDYVDRLFAAWDGRVKRESDLCCYFFEKARARIAAGRLQRAGLLATQGIRGGANQATLRRIKETGDIFFAVDDREWVLDGAAVQVAMVGFDDGSETRRRLLQHYATVESGSKGPRRVRYHDLAVEGINADLTSQLDLTAAVRLAENAGISFMGDTKVGPFEIDEATATHFLTAPNPDGRANADVVRPWVNGLDLTRRPRGMWIVDFPPDMSEKEAALYEKPFEHIAAVVKPDRAGNKRETYAQRWWIHAEARPAMRAALEHRHRYLATPNLTKYRFFVWLEARVLPDHQLIVFARDDDYFFGVLHSRVHEAWALRMGT